MGQVTTEPLSSNKANTAVATTESALKTASTSQTPSKGSTTKSTVPSATSSATPSQASSQSSATTSIPSVMQGTTYPKQSFEVITSPLTRSDGASTITYTAHFVIKPVTANFGNPTITAHLFANYTCLNSDMFSQTIRYSDTNNQMSLNCVVSRVLPYNGNGSLPPLPSGSSFTIEIYGNTADGSYIYGMPSTFYPLESGFDR